jgi:hypothetical protein
MKFGTFKAKVDIAIIKVLEKRFGDAGLGNTDYEFECFLSLMIPMVDDSIIETAIKKYEEVCGN